MKAKRWFVPRPGERGRVEQAYAVALGSPDVGAHFRHGAARSRYGELRDPEPRRSCLSPSKTPESAGPAERVVSQSVSCHGGVGAVCTNNTSPKITIENSIREQNSASMARTTESPEGEGFCGSLGLEWIRIWPPMLDLPTNRLAAPPLGCRRGLDDRVNACEVRAGGPAVSSKASCRHRQERIDVDPLAT